MLELHPRWWGKSFVGRLYGAPNAFSSSQSLPGYLVKPRIGDAPAAESLGFCYSVQPYTLAKNRTFREMSMLNISSVLSNGQVSRSPGPKWLSLARSFYQITTGEGWTSPDFTGFLLEFYAKVQWLERKTFRNITDQQTSAWPNDLTGVAKWLCDVFMSIFIETNES